jgi:hypothetical protein
MSFKLLPPSVSYLKMHFLKDDRFGLFEVNHGIRPPTVQNVLIETFSIK